MNKQLSSDTDFSAMFDIEMDAGANADVAAAADTKALLCSKCNGRGKFVGYSGKVIGNCFTCNGTGLSRTACVTLKNGDCAKCVGTGEWSAGRACFACNGTGKEQVAADINVDAIATAFAAARDNGIKSPKLRLADFLFSRAPDAGKNAGAIYVKRDGEYLGKIAGGKFTSSFACDAPTKAQVIEAAADPHKAAKAYGQRTGSCACCGRELTNKLSIELSIGPICRDKFGWG